MTFANFVVLVCGMYLFYFTACFVWDAFFISKKSIKGNSNHYSIDISDMPEMIDVDEEEYAVGAEKKKINQTDFNLPQKPIVEKVVHQGIVVTPQNLKNFAKEAKSYMSMIRT